MIVLRNQIYASERSADELNEQLMRDHRIAMICMDIEELVGDVIEHIEQLNAHIFEMQKASSPAAVMGCFGEIWFPLYMKLEALARRVVKFTEQANEFGHTIARSRELRNLHGELAGIASFNPGHVKDAIESLRRGEGRSLGDIERELFPEAQSAS